MQVVKDITDLLEVITFKRMVNFLKVYGSYQRSVLIGKPVHKGMPVSLAIEPTTSCNLNCPQCPSGLKQFSRPTGNMELELYTNIIDELSPYLSHLLLYFQGEPLLHKDFLKMVRIARDKNIYTATSTNGHYLTEENCNSLVDSGINKIIVSLDGLDARTYEKYRVGGNYFEVIQGIKNLVQAKNNKRRSRPIIELQFLAFSHNEHQIKDFKPFAKYLGADNAAIKTAQVYDLEKDAELVPENPKYSRYKKENGKLSIKSKLKNKCFRMWSSPVITVDGKVIPCCFDKDANHVLGELSQVNFKEIWQSDEINSFRKKLFSFRKEIEICKNCTEGLRL